MALTNIFSVKKTPYQLGQAARTFGGKVATSAYNAAPNAAGRAAASMIPGGSTLYAAAKKVTSSQPVRNFISGLSGQSQQNQSMNRPQIQGSGMNSNYASNASNYQPPKPAEAPVTKPPTNQPAAPGNVPNAGQSWMNYAQAAADRQQKLAAEQQTQKNQFIKDKYSLANKQLGEALPAAQQQFGQFKSNAEATIADLLAGGERQKSQAADYQGEAQRLAAQTLRETQGQTQRTFANLGTLDSRGEGSFGQATENQASEFNRFTQQGLKALADKKAEIDSTVGQAERSARATITQEEAKMNELARNIQYALQNNNLQEAQDLTDAFNQSQQYIYDIEDSLAQTKYQFALESEKVANEMKKTFTPEFMAGGKPTNQAEYEFFIKNNKDIQSAYGNADGSSSNKVNGIIDQLSGMNTEGITGLMRFGLSDESRNSEGLLKQLSSELQLEEAKRLKGQGAMSDAERAILANAVASFNLDEKGRPRVSDDRFKDILQELKTGFSSGGTVRVVSPTGQVGQIDQSELQEAIANGWRQQ